MSRWTVRRNEGDNRMNRCCLWIAAAVLIVPAQLLMAANPKTARGLSDRVDQAISAKLKEEQVPASPRADDAEFLRRVCLDITGVIPSAERAKAFLDSSDADKRAKLIDELLASKDYGKRMADLWQDLL